MLNLRFTIVTTKAGSMLNAEQWAAIAAQLTQEQRFKLLTAILASIDPPTRAAWRGLHPADQRTVDLRGCQ